MIREVDKLFTFASVCSWLLLGKSVCDSTVIEGTF